MRTMSIKPAHHLIALLLLLPTGSASATPAPTAGTSDQLTLRRGTLSLGGSIGLTLRHESIADLPGLTRTLADGSVMTIAGSAGRSETFFGVTLAPQLGYFLRPSLEFVAQLLITAETSDADDSGYLPLRQSTTTNVNGTLGVRLFFWQTAALKPYVGVHGGGGQVAGVGGDSGALLLELEPGLLLGMTSSLALRLSAPFRTVFRFSGPPALAWTPTLGLAVFL